MSREIIKRAFDRMFEHWGIVLPDDFDCDSLPRSVGERGWTINVRYVPDLGDGGLEVFASHRMTNDSLERIESDGSVTTIKSCAPFINLQTRRG